MVGKVLVRKVIVRRQMKVDSQSVPLWCLAFSILVTSLAGSGCARRQVFEPRAITDEELAPVEHIIRYPGENLGLVSAWYTGKASNWDRIADANPGLDPNRLRVGDLIIIPSELVLRSQELPPEKVEEMLAEGLKDFESSNAPDSLNAAEPSASGGSKNERPASADSEKTSKFPIGRPEPKISLPAASNEGQTDSPATKDEANKPTQPVNQNGSPDKKTAEVDNSAGTSQDAPAVKTAAEKRPTPPPSRFKTQEEMLRELLAE
jgi:hypothetical protein